MAQIAYKSAGAATTGWTETNGAALNLPCPATVDANDILVAHVIHENVTTAPTTPAGWTHITGPLSISTVARQWVYAKLADGSEDGANINFGTAGGTSGRSGRIYSFSGYVGALGIADIVAIKDQQNKAATGTTLTNPSVKATGPNVLAVGLCFIQDNNAFAIGSAATNGTWTEPVAEATSTTIGAQGCTVAIQTASVAEGNTINGGNINIAAADPAGVVGLEIRDEVYYLDPDDETSTDAKSDFTAQSGAATTWQDVDDGFRDGATTNVMVTTADYAESSTIDHIDRHGLESFTIPAGKRVAQIKYFAYVSVNSTTGMDLNLYDNSSGRGAFLPTATGGTKDGTGWHTSSWSRPFDHFGANDSEYDDTDLNNTVLAEYAARGNTNQRVLCHYVELRLEAMAAPGPPLRRRRMHRHLIMRTTRR